MEGTLQTICIALFVGIVVAGAAPHLIAQSRQPAEKGRNKPAIGFVLDSSDFDGAGCTLWSKADPAYTDGRHIFLADFDGRAVMNIDGLDQALKLAWSSEEKGSLKIGKRSAYRYEGPGVTVSVRYVVTGMCKPDDESCEVTDYNAAVAVTTRSGMRRIQTHGICGS
jgi:hypothetical protein